MEKKAVSGIMLTLLLIGMLTFAFNIQPVKATGTIYIRADGSIDPPTAPISTVDNITYIFTDNINDYIVVERDNIIVDGAGYTVQGTGSGDGISLSYRSNVTIKNVEVIMFLRGIWLSGSTNNILTNNTIRLNSGRGILLYDRSNDNIISNSTISDNDGVGIDIRSVYHGGGGASNNNIVINSKIYNNTGEGIDIYGSANNEVRNCLLKSNGPGTFDVGGLFISDYSSNTLIINSEISLNNGNGINIGYASGQNTIKYSVISENNGDGVRAWDTTNNVLINNNITYNNYGVYFSSNARNNTLYHNNFIDNTQQVYIDPYSYDNIWDDGYPSGGNYWSDYTGVDNYSGPNQDQPGGDGIGDTPYGNIDRYPLMNPPAYFVTIKAHCYTEGVDVSVSIIFMDGWPTSYTTPHTFGLTGTHTFTVLSTDPNGHPFQQWNTGETSTTITVNSGGTYTAYYQAKYTLTITTTAGGTTDPSPGTYTYWEGTAVNVAAIPSLGYILDHWELDVANVGAPNPISVTMKADHTLHAVFSWVGTYTLTITTTTGGTTSPMPEIYTYTAGTVVSVTAIPNTGYNFDHWELDGVDDTSNPITVTMDIDHTLHAVFTYDVTIEAYCYTEGAPVSVDITMDGSPTGFNTPHTFIGLTGTHTFTVPDTDANGHPFKQWSTGSTSTTITVTTGGTYTAYYQAKYDLTITTTAGGTTDPSPGTYSYWDGTTESVTAIPDTNYVFDHWELDGSNAGSQNPISVTMDSDHTLHAVFEYSPPVPVGGIVSPIDKLGLLAPYIALAIAVVAITIGAVYGRKRWSGKAVVQTP